MSVNNFSSAMNSNILPFNEALRYLHQNNLNIDKNDESLSIPSNSAFVYSLKNGEILVIPSDLDSSAYPSILFKDRSSFVQCCKDDYFPIPDTFLTWLEKNSSNVQLFNKDSNFSRGLLKGMVDVNLPFTNRDDIYDAYSKICKLLKKKKLGTTEIDEVFYGFAFEIMKYFITEKGYTYALSTRYEVYNPYYYPYLRYNGKDIDIVSLLLSSLKTKSENSFIGFYHFATAPLD